MPIPRRRSFLAVLVTVLPAACEGPRPEEAEVAVQEARKATEDQYLYGDWNGDGETKVAFRRGNCVHMDLDKAGGADRVQCYGNGNGQQYLVGDWDGNGTDNLAVRNGNCVAMDFNFDGAHDRVQCYGAGDSDEYFVGDWNGDRRDNLAVRRGNCFYMDDNFDGAHDRVQCFGNGDGQRYLVGDLDGDGRDNLAVRSGGCVYADTDFDGTHNRVECFGNGDSEDEYVFGGWADDTYLHERLAVRRNECVLMDFNGGGAAERTQCMGMGTRLVTPPAGPLQYLLTDRLKKNGCSGDRDGDCLDDRGENELAQLINPIVMWDENEDCFSKREYYQVRPVGRSHSFQVSPSDRSFVESTDEDVDRWYPLRGKYYVAVTFLQAFSIDCNMKAEVYIAGHVGDGEAVTYLLSSIDLATWTIEQGHYRAHGLNYFHDRGHLEATARDLRRTNPLIASDEGGHGSYAGAGVHSAECTIPDRYGFIEGSFDLTMRDCFYDDGLFDDGHLGSAYNRGKWHSMLVDHNRDNNIGEPGHWNPAFITISNGGRTGAIADRGGIEFISDEPGARFCGWQCPERNGIGDCQRDIRINPIRSTRECTGSLWGAVDKSCYRVRGQSFGCH